MAKKSTWRRALYFLGLAIALPLFGRQLWLSYQSLRSGELVLVRPTYLLVALGLTVVMYFVQTVGWMWLMRYLGVRLTLRQCLAGFIMSFLPRYIPGSVWGYVSRGAWLEERFGVSYATSSLGSFLEVGFFILTTGLVTALGVVVLRPALAPWAFLGVAVLLAGAGLGLPHALRVYRCRFDAPSASAAAIVESKWAWGVIGLFMGFWFLYGGAIGATGLALGQGPTPWSGLAMAAAQSWLVGLLVLIVPAGLGVRETTLATLLVMQAAASPEAAASTAVLSRFSLLFAEVIWLVTGLLLTRSDRIRTPEA